jgi:phenylpyruvate tautomerase PptA (4-oxalocrotonate tautomerase family)
MGAIGGTAGSPVEEVMMVFVRVHLIKGRLSAAQKDELGAKLVQAVADVEGLVNNEKNKETSWVQFYEFEPENWYAPANLAGANPDSRIQLDIVTPQKLVSTPEEARTLVGKATEAVRSVLGPGQLPAHGPWVHAYILPFDQFALDGRIPDWEGFRAHMNASTPEKADEVLAIAYGPGRHTSTWLQE